MSFGESSPVSPICCAHSEMAPGVQYPVPSWVSQMLDGSGSVRDRESESAETGTSGNEEHKNGMKVCLV
jgi:hypothetical protein